MRKNNGNWENTPLYAICEEDFTTRCEECGHRIIIGEGYYRSNGKPYCEECVESSDLENLIRICETEVSEIYRSLGLDHQFVGAERG